MATLRVDVAYDGTGFRGFATQSGLRTIQGELSRAFETVLGALVELAVAGRTDAGVHARGQVVSLRVDGEVDLERLPRALNGLLGPEITVRAVTEVDESFNARFSAMWRQYRYSISTDDVPDPLTRGFVWHIGPRVDVGSMISTAADFVGEHDFSSFCRSVEGKSNVRRVEEARWDRVDKGLEFWITSNAFCHQMVRSLVGLAYDVGRGYTSARSVREIVESGDRSRVVTVAPPHGLTLWSVGY